MLEPPHFLYRLFWRLCGHFARFFFAASPLVLLPPTPLHESTFGPRCLPRIIDASSFYCFQSSRPPTHLPLCTAPVRFPRPQHRTRRETDVFHPCSRFHDRPFPQVSEARTSFDSRKFLLLLHLLHLMYDGRHLALLSRQIASFTIPPQLLFLCLSSYQALGPLPQFPCLTLVECRRRRRFRVRRCHCVHCVCNPARTHHVPTV